MKPPPSRLILFALLWMVTLAACGRSPDPTPAPALPAADQGQTPVAATPVSQPTPAAAVQEFTPVIVAGNYEFTEGPATDANGNVYFSDINTGTIYKWSPDGSVSIFVTGLSLPNGLAFDKDGVLIACEGGKGRLIALDAQGNLSVVADQYNGLRFNEPNDLWLDPQGGVYFTDPVYQGTRVQDSEAVYYVSPDHSQVTRVIGNLVRPNGIVGTADGKTLYVADHGAGQTFAYDITGAGVLSNQRLLIASGSDGLALDASGNLYLTTPNQVTSYDATGKQLAVIPTPENPTNVTFAGKDGQTLFITARTAVYTVPMRMASSTTSGFTLTSPDVAEGGTLPVEYTCDGASSTLALNWSGAPAGTQSYAVMMHHVASPEDIHWYWVLYNIPADVTSLAKNSTGIGDLGTNSVNDRMEYAPPCSKGPGAKTYIYTVYALSAEPQFTVPASQVTRAVLLDAIQDITLASAELHVTYTRK